MEGRDVALMRRNVPRGRAEVSLTQGYGVVFCVGTVFKDTVFCVGTVDAGRDHACREL